MSAPVDRNRRHVWIISSFLVFSVFLVIAGALHITAGYLGMGATEQELLYAAKLEPDNAERWRQLGLMLSSGWGQLSLQRATSYYEMALARNPRSSHYWMELAAVCELMGDVSKASLAWQHAQENYPISSEVAWKRGNFSIRQGQIPEGFHEIRFALKGQPDLVPFAIRVAWNATGDDERILDELLPRESDALLAALEFFLSIGNPDSALKAWARVQALNVPVELARSFPLLEQLVRLDRASEARLVWQQALALAGRKAVPVVPGSLIWDGGFEENFLNGGFGWHELDVAGASIALDSSLRRSGAGALRVSFGGSANIDFQHVRQHVVVEPRTRYHFQAYVRCEGISTDSGLRFRIFDRRQPAALSVESENLTGTITAWTAQELDFVTGQDTHFLTVVLQRRPSRKLDNKLSGTIWVDDVSLIPVESASRAKP